MTVDPKNFFEHDGDAWIDLPTNFTSLPGFSTGHDLKALLDKRIPSAKASSFIHEMTHHWCFDSPLGNVLSILKSRITYGLAALQSGEEFEEFDLIDDIVRYQASTELLRPFVEGLALFAEHDARAEGAAIYSRPILQLFKMSGATIDFDNYLGLPGIITPNIMSKMLRESVDRMRLSNSGVERKADLLCSSIDAGESPYLAGYLSLKGVWIRQKELRGKVINSDQFLSYMRCYVFYDYGLIKAILSDKHEFNIVTEISAYLHSRILALNEVDLEPSMRDWDRAANSEFGGTLMSLSSDGRVVPLSKHVQMPGLLNKATESADGHSRLCKIVSWLDHSKEANPVLRAIKYVGSIRISLRGLMPIFGLSVEAIDKDTVRAKDGVTFGAI